MSEVDIATVYTSEIHKTTKYLHCTNQPGFGYAQPSVTAPFGGSGSITFGGSGSITFGG
jgi:hypothetical protein